MNTTATIKFAQEMLKALPEKRPHWVTPTQVDIMQADLENAHILIQQLVEKLQEWELHQNCCECAGG